MFLLVANYRLYIEGGVQQAYSLLQQSRIVQQYVHLLHKIVDTVLNDPRLMHSPLRIAAAFYTPQKCTLIPISVSIAAFAAIALSASAALGA